MWCHNEKKGFTLIEAIIVIALISLLAGLSIPFYSDILSRNAIFVSSDATIRTLRRAQVLSKAVANDDGWSVKLETGLIRLYKGSDYNTRNTQYDEDIKLSSGVTFSGNTDVKFTKFTGVPNVTGTTTIVGPDASTRNLTLNAFGLIDY